MLSNVLELAGLAALVAAATILTLWLTGSALASVGVGLLVAGAALVLVAWGLSAPQQERPKLVRVPGPLTNKALESDRAA